MMLRIGSFSHSYRIQSLATFVLIGRAGGVRRVSAGVTSEAPAVMVG